MRLANVHEDDIVLCDRGGRRFYALVVAKQGRTLAVRPLDNRISYHAATSTQVKGHWRKSGQKRGNA